MADNFVVEVNEGVVEATRQGVDWWHAFSLRFSSTGRLVYIKKPCVIGGVVEVACDSKDDAGWLAAQMIDVHGLPKMAVRVKAAQSVRRATSGPKGPAKTEQTGKKVKRPGKRRVETVDLPDVFGGAA